jgi:hypothetical protein
VRPDDAGVGDENRMTRTLRLTNIGALIWDNSAPAPMDIE